MLSLVSNLSRRSVQNALCKFVKQGSNHMRQVRLSIRPPNSALLVEPETCYSLCVI